MPTTILVCILKLITTPMHGNKFFITKILSDVCKEIRLLCFSRFIYTTIRSKRSTVNPHSFGAYVRLFTNLLQTSMTTLEVEKYTVPTTDRHPMFIWPFVPIWIRFIIYGTAYRAKDSGCSRSMFVFDPCYTDTNMKEKSIFSTSFVPVTSRLAFIARSLIAIT